MQLVNAVEQCRNIDRQIQLAANQKKKTELTLTEVDKRGDDDVQYRSMGRMFVKISKEELKNDMNADLARLTSDTERNTALKTVYDA